MTFTLDQMAYEALLGNPNITEEWTSQALLDTG